MVRAGRPGPTSFTSGIRTSMLTGAAAYVIAAILAYLGVPPMLAVAPQAERMRVVRR